MVKLLANYTILQFLYLLVCLYVMFVYSGQMSKWTELFFGVRGRLVCISWGGLCDSPLPCFCCDFVQHRQ